MAIFDSWESVTTLNRGEVYRLSYRVFCPNATTPTQVAVAMRQYGITFLPSSGIVWGSVFEATDSVSVDRSMSISEFSLAFESAFQQASSQSWLACEASASRVDRRVRGDGIAPSAGFSAGIISAILLLAVGGFVVYRYGGRS